MGNTENTKQLAQTVRDQFELKKRTDGSVYWSREGSDDWIQELCHKAHGDLLPDDYKYEMIVRALDAIREDEELNEIEAPVYTSDLTNWLGSSVNRLAYVDDAIDEFGYPKNGGTFLVLQWGWHAEFSEVYYSVLASLEEHLK